MPTSLPQNGLRLAERARSIQSGDEGDDPCRPAAVARRPPLSPRSRNEGTWPGVGRQQPPALLLARQQRQTMLTALRGLPKGGKGAEYAERKKFLELALKVD